MNMVEDKWLFLQKFMGNPKEVGSITPSSKFLAKRMLKAVNWNDVRAIGELGAGTGAITQYLAERVGPRTNVSLFEKDGLMRSRLQTNYPTFQCYPDATKLVDAVQMQGISYFDCILSGLPFFNFSPELREELMNQIFQALKPGGQFIAFQYSLQMKRELTRYSEIESIQIVPLNLPPAFVYVCRKSGVI
nr:methyltransferase domain-containing protein [Paenibacillus selenitireducens]